MSTNENAAGGQKKKPEDEWKNQQRVFIILSVLFIVATCVVVYLVTFDVLSPFEEDCEIDYNETSNVTHVPTLSFSTTQTILDSTESETTLPSEPTALPEECYITHNVTMNKTDALQYCEDSNASLVVFESREKFESVLNYAEKHFNETVGPGWNLFLIWTNMTYNGTHTFLPNGEAGYVKWHGKSMPLNISGYDTIVARLGEQWKVNLESQGMGNANPDKSNLFHPFCEC